MTLPEEFVSYTSQLFGESLWQKFLAGMEEEPPVSVRINPFKYRGDVMTLPTEEDAEVEWCADGRYLKNRPQFTLDPLLHAGAYYVQEAASMYVAEILRRYADLSSPLRALDLCAAPGGKTTAVRSMLPEGSVLMANEPVRQRANILVENILKFGHPDVMVTNNYAVDYQRSGITFDVIVADVPCSGEGMFRKDEGAVEEWSAANVRKCAVLQREIITDILPCLRPGGLLVYSTCTFNAFEDEENVEYIVEELGMELLHLRHFIPGDTRSEGLFMAALRKPGDGENVMARVAEKKKDRKAKKGKGGGRQTMEGAAQVSQWITDDGDFDICRLGGHIVAVRKAWRDMFDTAEQKLRLMHAGVELGEPKGKDIVPAEGLALSICMNRNTFPVVDLDLPTALSYLRREPLTLSPDTPRGYVAVTYKTLPLGFVKNLGNRANNLFPQEWRIRTAK